jgi:hypothetical protein
MKPNLKKFIILLSLSFLILVVILVLDFYLNNPIFLSYGPIFNFYDQTNFPSNILQPFFLAYFSPIGGFIIGLGLSIALAWFTSKVNRIIANRFKKEYPIEPLDIIDNRNFLWLSFKRAILAEIFSFTMTFQLLRLLNLPNLLLNISFDQGETLKLIYSYYAALPLSILISSILYTSIWFIDSIEVYFTYKKDGEIVNRHKVSTYFINLLRNYTAISTVITIFLTAIDLRADFLNLGISSDKAIFGALFFIAGVFFAFPFYFFSNIAYVYLLSSPMNRIYLKILKKRVININ